MTIKEGKWEVNIRFDYDDYYQAGRGLTTKGKYLPYEYKGSKYRDRSKAQAYVDKLNEGNYHD